MSQSGLKHVATEPDHLDAKRERHRRGPSGRASVLRRAPSDSDCSIETASLSADSADRVRPALVPVRTSKQRSRRRGSEWEVLEGLKDGQRFERRPDVFNGYLHKKRKWPLKGWHKRFFVLDGGILVYARSPCDVARGRLHGSVDVGLSVISAKANRRRIDIDADEFIYHLRAKTPDVFRTWTNVLKAHRLYRQHLLTFGARESAPKIHAPLDELPPTDTSSQSSQLSTGSEFTNVADLKSFSLITPYHVGSLKQNPVDNWEYQHDDSELMPVDFEPLDDVLQPNLNNRSMCSVKCLEQVYKREIRDFLSQQKSPESIGVSAAEKQLNTTELERSSLKYDPYIKDSPINYCSNSTISKTNEKYDLKTKLSRETHIKLIFPVFSDLDEEPTKNTEKKIKLKTPINKSPVYHPTPETTTALFFLTRKKRCLRSSSPPSQMKRSRKSTNLVKYRNRSEEPPLNQPWDVPMLLRRYKDTNKTKINDDSESYKVGCDNEIFQVARISDNESRKINHEVQTNEKVTEHKVPKLLRRSKDTNKTEKTDDSECYKVGCDNEIFQVAGIFGKESHKTNHEVQTTEKSVEHKSFQDTITASEYDKITEQLIVSIFEAKRSQCNTADDIKYYVNKIIRELYDAKLSQTELHPVKVLFRSLLEYWLKTSCSENVKNVVKKSKSVLTQSVRFTRDAKLSTAFVPRAAVEKQVQVDSDIVKNIPKCDTKQATCSFEKERRIQELERLLKNTVYTSEYGRSDRSKDILITKKLIDNLESSSCPGKSETCSTLKPVCSTLWKRKYEVVCLDESKEEHDSSSSAEYKKIQNAVDGLISQTSITPGCIKQILDTYLQVLMGNSGGTSAQTSYDSETPESPTCDVQTESVKKRNSVGVATFKRDTNPKNTVDQGEVANANLDSGQVYMKNLLDKITTIITKQKKKSNTNATASTHVQPDDTMMRVESSLEENLNGKYLDKDLIMSNKDEILLDLTKYDLERISLHNSTTHDGSISITIKLKECSPNPSEPKHKNQNLKFSEETTIVSPLLKNRGLHKAPYCITKKKCRPIIDPRISFKKSYIHYDASINKQKKDLRSYVSVSDASSKAYKILYDRDNLPPSTESKRRLKGRTEKVTAYVLPSRRKMSRDSMTKPKKKCRIVTNQHYAKYPPIRLKSPNTRADNASGGVIDEQLIIQLLENLTLLSQSLPGLYKDMSVFCLKLKRKHEKKPGVQLLGKIYNRTSVTDENAGYSSTTACPDQTVETLTDSSTEKATLVDDPIKPKNDKETYALVELKNAETQIVKLVTNKNQPTAVSNHLNDKDSHFDHKSTETIDAGVSLKSRLKIIDGAISTVIKSLLSDYDSCTNFRLVTNDKYARTARVGENEFKPAKEQNEMKPKPLNSSSKCVQIRLSNSDSSKNRQTNCAVYHFKHSDSSQSKDTNNVNVFDVYPIFMSSKFPLGSVAESSVFARVSDDLKSIYRCSSDPSFTSGLVSPTSQPLRSQAGFVAGTPGGRLNWIVESGGPLEVVNRDLGHAQASVQQLQRLLDAIELAQHHHDNDLVSLEGASPNVKKDRRKFGLRKKKSSSKCASVDLAPPPHVDPSASHTALSALTAPPSPGGGASSAPGSAASLPIACAAARPQSLPGAEALGTSIGAGGPASLASLTPDQQLREDFTVLAKDLVTTLKGVVSTLVCERGRLRAAMDSTPLGGVGASGGAGVAALRTSLTSALQQNSELRSRLCRIHDASDLHEISSVNDAMGRPFQQSLSFSSSCVSASEFFDAEEHEAAPAQDPTHDLLPAGQAGVIELDGDSSSEAGSLSSEEGDPSGASSDNSDGAMLDTEPETLRPPTAGVGVGAPWRRRPRLPCPRPTPGGPSLWNLLYKNIGKDLSQVSMPVTINEPLNMLQRLCEELEYCELLDSASECSSDLERCALVAAFAVSAYAATAHRAASKPFNPLLGETYECDRQDKGFRFLAEQVSHHPPISACHATSLRWVFWQEARIKTKFWGKSMEFQPAGRVHVMLLPRRDHYTWNKVTTCVHNLFGGQRWVDQYGDMHIVCRETKVSAKLNFIKASSWSSSRHEVRGFVTDESTGSRLRLSGRWSETLYAGDPPKARQLWRPGAMPPDYELYYGFTRFAMELNEMEPGLRELLPPTDTRFRPDQLALEEGDVDAAEQYKLSLEQAQRERRREERDHRALWFRKEMEDGEEVWVFTGEYWKAREAGFSGVTVPAIW